MSDIDALKPAGLEGFELWDKKLRAPVSDTEKVAFVSIRACGTIGMNRAAHGMWGSPDACQVMFDPERRRLALKPCSEEDANAFEIYSGNVQIPCRVIFNYYGVQLHEARRYNDPKVIDGVLVVDL